MSCAGVQNLNKERNVKFLSPFLGSEKARARVTLIPFFASESSRRLPSLASLSLFPRFCGLDLYRSSKPGADKSEIPISSRRETANRRKCAERRLGSGPGFGANCANRRHRTWPAARSAKVSLEERREFLHSEGKSCRNCEKTIGGRWNRKRQIEE